jgi:DNA-binding HxlR family transcriptional regulator
MLKMPEGISTNILADRLALLVREGILETEAYQDSPPRHEYRLTKKGADLLPVMLAMAKWSQAHIPGRVSPPDWLVASGPNDFYPKS